MGVCLLTVEIVPGAGLSIEQRKRVTLGVELVAKPTLLFLDEPTSGLDGQSAYNIVRFMRRLVDGGQAVLVSDDAVTTLLKVISNISGSVRSISRRRSSSRPLTRFFFWPRAAGWRILERVSSASRFISFGLLLTIPSWQGFDQSPRLLLTQRRPLPRRHEPGRPHR